MRKNQTAAFTLVEALICLGVIIVVSGVVYVVAGAAIRKGKAASCSGRLHSFGLASSLYAADHGDFLPPHLWRRYGRQPSGVSAHIACLVPYGFRPEDTFCPLDPLAHRDIDSDPSDINSQETSYVRGNSFPHLIFEERGHFYLALSLTQVDEPSKKIQLMDVAWMNEDKSLWISGHGFDSNRLFYDGHVAAQRLGSPRPE